jgi:hypothetical protein
LEDRDVEGQPQDWVSHPSEDRDGVIARRNWFDILGKTEMEKDSDKDWISHPLEDRYGVIARRTGLHISGWTEMES